MQVGTAGLNRARCEVAVLPRPTSNGVDNSFALLPDCYTGNTMGLLKVVIGFLLGLAVGYYFGTDHGWEDAVRTFGL